VASTSSALRLSCRSPFAWRQQLGFFAGRATPGVEAVVDGCYRRTLSVDGRSRIIEIAAHADGDALDVRFLDGDDLPGPAVAKSVSTVFDVNAPVDRIHDALGKDPLLASLLENHPGVRVPGAWDGFELTVRAILGQQISVKAATTIAGRIAKRYGDPVGQPGARRGRSLNRLFPSPERLARGRFNKLGLVQSRIDTIRAVAKAVVSQELCFDGRQSAGDTRDVLLSIKGIGDWTAQYVAMRALRDPDAFPATDLGLLSALDPPNRVTPGTLSARAEHWRPWRAYAAMLLWGSLPGSGG
jgi:AraC family transcriptional regulator of adaptative response / DNA-3-methyladenine glycosylase II